MGLGKFQSVWWRMPIELRRDGGRSNVGSTGTCSRYWNRPLGFFLEDFTGTKLTVVVATGGDGFGFFVVNLENFNLLLKCCSNDCSSMTSSQGVAELNPERLSRSGLGRLGGCVEIR